MNKYEFFIAFTAIFCGFWFLKSLVDSRRERWQARHKQKEQQPDQPTQQETAAKLRAMEERVQVLEKIITDRQSDLRDRFRDLEKD